MQARAISYLKAHLRLNHASEERLRYLVKTVDGLELMGDPAEISNCKACRVGDAKRLPDVKECTVHQDANPRGRWNVDCFKLPHPTISGRGGLLTQGILFTNSECDLRDMYLLGSNTLAPQALLTLVQDRGLTLAETQFNMILRSDNASYFKSRHHAGIQRRIEAVCQRQSRAWHRIDKNRGPQGVSRRQPRRGYARAPRLLVPA